jgi:hypothetical protein
MSEKTIVQKLGVKPGAKVLLIDAPQGYRKAMVDLPAGASVLTKPTDLADIVQVFVLSRQELETQLAQLKATLRPTAALWVSYPKGTSKIKTDINRDVIREYAETVGFRTVALFSVDDTWAALRLKVVA